MNAATLEEAIDRLPAAMEQEVVRVIESVRKMQEEQERAEKQESSNLILPR